jgi:hypothetical protein
MQKLATLEDAARSTITLRRAAEGEKALLELYRTEPDDLSFIRTFACELA